MTLKPIIYINVACMENFNDVLSNILNKIIDSGLLDNCERVNLTFNGPASLLGYSTLDLFKKMGDKGILLKGPDSLEFMEFPTLDKLWADSASLHEKTPILYLHTKGVSRKGSLTVQDWTDMMLYFNVEKWRDRLDELSYSDCTGANLGGSPDDYKKDPATWGYTTSPLCYSGNFWWANAGHIQELPKPSECPPSPTYKWRMYNEMWLCQIEGKKYHCCYHSNVNHYMSRHPREVYENC